MKRQIRRGVFESNSSSQHSLAIMKINEKYTLDEISNEIYLSKDGVWNIWDCSMEFGRSPFKVLGTFAQKWKYACASLVFEYNDEIYVELEEIAFKYIPGLKKIKLPTITESIPNKDCEENKDSDFCETYGMTEDELNDFLSKKEKKWGLEDGEVDYWLDSEHKNWRYEKPYTGYVDENIFGRFLKKENISLEEFLINKKYVVICDGDEYCVYDDMKKAGLINTEMIDYEFPEYS